MAATDRQQLAEAVRTAMKARGMTQAALAEAVGAHEQTIGNLVRAKHDPEPALIERIEEALDVDLSPAALIARAMVTMADDALRERLAQLPPSEQLILIGEVVRMVNAFKPPTHPDDPE